MHNQGPTSADVTEGSSGIWETNHYDWSNPNSVVLHTTDSNVWANSSSHTYTLTRQPDGLTDVDLAVMREGKNLKGKLLAIFLGSLGKGSLEKAFVNSVKAIEARNYKTIDKKTNP